MNYLTALLQAALVMVAAAGNSDAYGRAAAILGIFWLAFIGNTLFDMHQLAKRRSR